MPYEAWHAVGFSEKLVCFVLQWGWESCNHVLECSLSYSPHSTHIHVRERRTHTHTHPPLFIDLHGLSLPSSPPPLLFCCSWSPSQLLTTMFPMLQPLGPLSLSPPSTILGSKQMCSNLPPSQTACHPCQSLAMPVSGKGNSPCLQCIVIADTGYAVTCNLILSCCPRTLPYLSVK